jgi:glycerophosphoryl diester phosphodiesterase
VQFEFLDHPGPIPFAHRGGAGSLPENTMVAFANAVRLGYRYIETDVHSTADGALVAFHDADLSRVTDRSGNIHTLPYGEVAKARADGQGIPLLEEILSAWPEVRLNIDVKHWGAIDPLVRLIRRTKSINRVCVGAFSDLRIARVKRLLGKELCTSAGPGAALLLRMRSVSEVTGRLPQFAGAATAQLPEIIGPVTILDRRLVRQAHFDGLKVHAWTIDDPMKIAHLLDIGVDGIMSDDLIALKSALQARDLWF